jgi:Flp pilus assembly protein TadG
MEMYTIYKIYSDERGVSAILIAILMIVFLGFAALSLDLSHIFVAQNELHNAADAGALAGARFLYNDDGTTVNPGANQIAYNAAIANNSENVPVEVNWTSGNTGDVLRGHWSFATKTFTANASLEPVDLWDVSDEELDANTNFINAVQVTTQRTNQPGGTPIAAFFARIFGFENFQRTATAVAYIGFAGTLMPEEADQPIAICQQALEDAEGDYTCSIGRMLNSGSDPATHNTAGWTNFSQPCETANANEMRGLVCGDGNPEGIKYGEGIGANGGVQDNVFRDLRDCWINSATSHNSEDGLPNQPWALMLPVVDCPGNNVSNCTELVGAVTLQVIFISPEGGTPDINNAPREMGTWSNDSSDGQIRWTSFVDYFNLKNADGNPAPYDKKSIYFLPDCTYHEPVGLTGGHNFGVLARIPVLVK